MKKKQIFFIIFIILGGNYIYSQNPDTTLPNIYKDVLPGLKSDQINTNPSQERPYEEEDKQENNSSEEKQQKQSILLTIRDLLSNRTIVNIIILIIIFAIFFIYRIRKN